MKINSKKLFIYKNNTEITRDLSEINDSNSVLLGELNNLYIGFRKPLYNLFLSVLEGNEKKDTDLIIFKRKGGTWVEVNHEDRTHGLVKSGHIILEQVLGDKDELLEEEYTIDNKKMYWIRINASDNIEVNLELIDMVFSSNESLMAEEPDIFNEELLPSKSNSHIFSQVAARDYIINKINNAGRLKYNGISVSRINQFDVANISDLSLAETYYALYKIFSSLQDNASNDTYRVRANDYLEKFNSSWMVFKGLLVLDDNDDGKIENKEIKRGIGRLTFTR
jgi:hypothetical protein